MDTTNEEVFGVILRFLRAKDAGRLACVSKTMQLWVSRDAGEWKRRCECAFPSITLSPAKEVVCAHYGAEGSIAYMHLYAELVQPTGGLDALGGLSFKAGDFILLIDVKVGDEGVLVEAADYGEVRRDTLVMSSEGTQHFRGDFKGTCKIGAEERLCLALQAVVDRTAGGEAELLSCTLRLLHRSTGKILELMEKRAISDATHQLLDPRKKSFLQHNFYVDDDWSSIPVTMLPPIKAGQKIIELTITMLRAQFFFKKRTDATRKRLSEAESQKYSFQMNFWGRAI